MLAATLTIVPLAAACEVETDIDYACAIIGTWGTTIRSDASPDSVGPGGTVIHRFDLELPPPAGPEVVAINQVIVRLPLPDQVAEVTEVTFAGGNFVGSWEVRDRRLVLVLAGRGVRSDELRLPTATVEAEVAPDAPGGTMAWPAPEQVQLVIDFIGQLFNETCTVYPNAPAINNTNVEGPPNPAWTVPPTVVAPPTATTWPPDHVPPATTTTLPITVTTPTRPLGSTTTGPTTTTTVASGPGAPADDATFTLDCSILGPVTFAAGTDWAPATPARGGTVQITTALRPTTITTEVSTDLVYVHYPIPEGVTVEDVVFETGAQAEWATTGEHLIVWSVSGGVPLPRIEPPALTIRAQVGPDAGSAVILAGPSQVTFHTTFLGSAVVETCTAPTPTTIATIEVR